MTTQQFSELDEIVDAVSFGQVGRAEDLDDVDEAVKYEVAETDKRKSKVSKHHKLKMTLFWVLLWLSIVLLIVLVLLVVVYESGLSSAALTAPLWIAWDISPGAFTGCRTLPPQLYGSFGPTELLFWNISSGHPQPITEDIAGPELAGTWTIDEIMGTPNGATLIKWADDGKQQGVTSVECATAWGTWDLNYGWENGIIYNFTGQSFVYFGHIWRRTEQYFEIWEVADTDLSYHIDDMRAAIEGRNPDYALANDLRYLKAPMMGGHPTYPAQGIAAPPSHRWCWNYDDCAKHTKTLEETNACWDRGDCTTTGTSNF
jgi:hypothetical protein